MHAIFVALTDSLNQYGSHTGEVNLDIFDPLAGSNSRIILFSDCVPSSGLKNIQQCVSAHLHSLASCPTDASSLRQTWRHLFALPLFPSTADRIEGREIADRLTSVGFPTARVETSQYSDDLYEASLFISIVLSCQTIFTTLMIHVYLLLA